ncbi:hypothetical protein LTS18_010780, partial [Coniosporium uncinatum]
MPTSTDSKDYTPRQCLRVPYMLIRSQNGGIARPNVSIRSRTLRNPLPSKAIGPAFFSTSSRQLKEDKSPSANIQPSPDT